MSGNRFDIEEFSQIKKFNDCLLYASFRLEEIGSGSSRIAFLYEGKVLKIAKNKEGVAQNKAEANARFQSLEIFAKVFSRSERFEWVIMELCEQCGQKEQLDFLGTTSNMHLLSENDCEYRTDLSPLERKMVSRGEAVNNVCFSFSAIDKLSEYLRSDKKQSSSQFFSPKELGALYRLVPALLGIKGKDDITGVEYSSKNLVGYNDQLIWLLKYLIVWIKEYEPDEYEIGDVAFNEENWGISLSRPEKRLVILDYGFNEEVSLYY